MDSASVPASGSASGRCFSCFISNWNGGCFGGTGSRARRPTFALVIISCCSELKTEPLVRGSPFPPRPVRLTREETAGIDGESVPQGARYLEFICRITHGGWLISTPVRAPFTHCSALLRRHAHSLSPLYQVSMDANSGSCVAYPSHTTGPRQARSRPGLATSQFIGCRRQPQVADALSLVSALVPAPRIFSLIGVHRLPHRSPHQ